MNEHAGRSPAPAPAADAVPADPAASARPGEHDDPARREPGAFPGGFLWGAATSAYQVEGYPLADGAGASIWHRFAHTPGRTFRGQTGDIACDSYHRWPEDLRLMREIGLSAADQDKIFFKNARRILGLKDPVAAKVQPAARETAPA